jgi:hypothetical protein
MPTTIPCPSCRRELRLPEVLIGKLVQCPACGMTFTALFPEPPAEVQERVQSASDTSDPSAGQDSLEESPGSYEEEDEDRPVRRRPRRYRYSTPHRGAAILTLGILSIVICGPLGPFAWVMGNTDLAEIRAGRMDPEGEGLTQAGRILGIIGTVRLGLELVVILCWGGAFCLVGLGGGLNK